MPKFQKDDDISLFLVLFERQAKVLDIVEDQWVTHLIGVLPTDIVHIIAREPEERAKDYSVVNDLLLQRSKISAEKFRQLFTKHQKSPEESWYDFYYDLQTYFEGWRPQN